MALQKRCWQVHSAVPPKVRLQKQPKARGHGVCDKMTSGQLPFLGLTLTRQARRALFIFKIGRGDPERIDYGITGLQWRSM